MEVNKIKFYLPEIIRGDGWVELNGRKLPGVRAVSLSASVNEVTEVTLTLLAAVEGEVRALHPEIEFE